ncbi:hypothetical protein [Deinococcus cellulosilyticus]|uniref:Uncharacterized protein n=1 Tax=Deinococcus cellulosilyticus (strain DSM 18568 / NBRC 106333 / KACC 11606 / 5516J-15) TaxID=1223518 RepID=A0A511N1M5_DEIC1|nr:hypothetical protein [Deinococcus cellulosilyticus]GEM46358.1 hypothetical protein DC3_19930 [Deinococcus cellulosilyticus NBRC 106333 = KACC 11606]
MTKVLWSLLVLAGLVGAVVLSQMCSVRGRESSVRWTRLFY